MDSLNIHIQEYKKQLSRGHIQKAYKEIMDFMSDLRAYLISRHPDYTASALYFGYMDMTYFAFTPSNLKNMKLKIAVVFLHQEGRFGLWLAGNNRKTQAEYIKLLSQKDIGGYKLSKVQPGEDSIIVSPIVEKPDFNDPEEMKKQIEIKIIKFAEDIYYILK